MLSFLLPERCIHCERPTEFSRSGIVDTHKLTHYLCEICFRIIQRRDGPDESTVRDQFQITASALPIEHCMAAYSFMMESPIQSIIHAFKYSGMTRLAECCGRSIVTMLPGKTDFIIPVPLHRTRFAERGYNQAESLADGLAKDTKTAVLCAVKRTRPTPSQTNLSIPERIENVRGAFALTRLAYAAKGKQVLIVDDVMTTGSTLASVVETIMEAKPATISILTLAMAV
jgi:ComF family protein